MIGGSEPQRARLDDWLAKFIAEERLPDSFRADLRRSLLARWPIAPRLAADSAGTAYSSASAGRRDPESRPSPRRRCSCAPAGPEGRRSHLPSTTSTSAATTRGGWPDGASAPARAARREPMTSPWPSAVLDALARPGVTRPARLRQGPRRPRADGRLAPLRRPGRRRDPGRLVRRRPAASRRAAGRAGQRPGARRATPTGVWRSYVNRRWPRALPGACSVAWTGWSCSRRRASRSCAAWRAGAGGQAARPHRRRA